MFKISKFVAVNDNWYPCYPDNKIEIILEIAEAIPSIKGYETPSTLFRAWGMDDFFLEMQFDGTMDECKLKFEEWESSIYNNIPDVTNQEYYYNLGFYGG